MSLCCVVLTALRVPLGGSCRRYTRPASTAISRPLTHMVDDVGLVEELAQDAFVAALPQWSGEGVQRIPGAWLKTIAKRRAMEVPPPAAARHQTPPDLIVSWKLGSR